MSKPDNQRIDIEALKRELRQEINTRIKTEINNAIDETLLQDFNPEYYADTVDPDNPENGGTPETPTPSENGPKIVVKFRNANKIFTIPTEINSFGDILVSGDGTVTVNVIGKIFDDREGIESYKVRIKRIA